MMELITVKELYRNSSKYLDQKVKIECRCCRYCRGNISGYTEGKTAI